MIKEARLTITMAGCGALGSLLAARLLAAGHRVQAFQRRGEHFQALQRNGITLDKDRDGSFRRYRLHAVADDPTRLASSRLIIVLVKAHQTAALEPLGQLLSDEGMVLSLQNGLGNADILAELFGPQRIAAGVASYGAYRVAPGVVAWGGEGLVTLGPWVAGVRVDWIVQLLQQAGLQVDSMTDPRPAIWTKLAINAMVNPVTALTGMCNGATAGNRAAMDLMQNLGRETVAAAARAGILLDFDAIWKLLCDNLERTAVNRTSMLQDVTAGRRTEIDSISGAVLGYAASNGEFPFTRVVHALIRAIDLYAEEAEVKARAERR